jgi:hypothetical protein
VGGGVAVLLACVLLTAVGVAALRTTPPAPTPS